MSIRKLAATILATLGVVGGLAYASVHADHAQTRRAEAATMVEYAAHVVAAAAIEEGLTARADRSRPGPLP